MNIMKKITSIRTIMKRRNSYLVRFAVLRDGVGIYPVFGDSLIGFSLNFGNLSGENNKYDN